MLNFPSVSLITLTKNRALYLRLCFKSLIGQLHDKDEIVVLDNGSTDETPEVIKKYQKMLPLLYIRSREVGYPKLYNQAIKNSSNEIVVFLDDDCIAGRSFIQAVKRSHSSHKNCVVQGKTYSLPKNNIYAEIMGDHYQNWLHVNTMGNGEMRVFDNKNASVPRKVLTQHGGFLDSLVFGSEDIELGIRMRHRGVKIFFDPSVVAYHHERSTLAGFLQQHLRIARSEGVLDRRLADENKIHMLSIQKLAFHVKSAFLREVLYLVQGRIRDFFLLPILYILLLLLRIWGYTTVR